MSAKPFVLNFKPGIARDGTRFDSDQYSDGLWCRWRLGRPRKMGGYKQITDALFGTPRRIHMFYQNGQIICHVASVNGIQQVIFAHQTGELISIADRTPSTFTAGINIGFTMDAIFDTTSNVTQLIVHFVPDMGQIATIITTLPVIGQIDAATPLTPFSDPGAGGGSWTAPAISGGIVCVQPYVFDFDSYGLVQWSAPNLPLYLGVTGGSTGAGQARISAQKIVAGAPLRGGGTQSPAALFWSLSEVITATFVGSANGVFRFNTVSPSSSILSSRAVIEYDGLYFWVGIDRFLVFNGTVTEVPNPTNLDWFFNNLTPNYEDRVFAFKVPRYGEIWWCAPMFGNTEPSHAVIYNIRENCWYDTELPNGGRGAAFYAQGFHYPVMGGTLDPVDDKYSLWMHEFEFDEVRGDTVTPIRSYFETGVFGGPRNDPPDDQGLSFHQLEPDIDQTGDMEVYLLGQANARAPVVQGPTVPLLAIPGVPQEQFVSFTPTMPLRLARLHVESNTLGGNYIGGRSIAHAQPGDARLIS
jgi:hypothetical protein